MPELKTPVMDRASDATRDAATKESPEVLEMLGTCANGLTEEEAAARLEQYGPNEVARERKHGWVERLYVASLNPLVILLTVLAIVTFATAENTSDNIGGVVMLAMVFLGLSLRFIQETRA